MEICNAFFSDNIISNKSSLKQKVSGNRVTKYYVI